MALPTPKTRRNPALMQRLTPLEQRVLGGFMDCIEALADAGLVESIILFGSRARGDAHEDSDLDVAVMCQGHHDRRLVGAITDAAIASLIEADALEVGLHPVVLFSGEKAHNFSLRTHIGQEGHRAVADVMTAQTRSAINDRLRMIGEELRSLRRLG